MQLKSKTVRNTKKKEVIDKTIISQYFKLLQNKDIEGLKNLFWSDAIVYEPFSKLEQGLRGWTQIEPFLKVAMMASESHQVDLPLKNPICRTMKLVKPIAIAIAI